MNKKICINQFFKSEHNRSVVDNYIHAIYPNKKFRLNNKRRIWHIKRNTNLLSWVEMRGVNI